MILGPCEASIDVGDSGLGARIGGGQISATTQIAVAGTSGKLVSDNHNKGEILESTYSSFGSAAFQTHSISAGMRLAREAKNTLNELEANVNTRGPGWMIQEVIDRWPAAVRFKQFPQLKETILDAAIADMKRVLLSTQL